MARCSCVGAMPGRSGKTTLPLRAIAGARRSTSLCAFIESAHALDTKYVHPPVDLLVISLDCGSMRSSWRDALVHRCERDATALRG